MIRKKSSFFGTIIGFLLILLFHLPNAYAEEQGIGFQVKPVFNSNQVEDNLGYYYISANPDETVELELLVTSTSDKDIKVTAAIENATTTNHGNLDYTSDLKQLDKSLKDPLSKIVAVEPAELTVKAKETEKIKMKLKTPSTKFEGIKMGRVVVKEKKDKKDNSGPITNEYQYGVGIMLTEEVKAFNDGKTLTLNKAEPKITNGSRVVAAEISAPTPKTIEKLKVRSYVTKRGDSKKIKERNVDDFTFAPNSKVDFEIPWGTSNFKPGSYTFHFQAKNSQEKFSMKKDFEISTNRSNQLNDESAFSVITSSKDKALIIAINSLLVILMAYILWRDKKWMEKLKAIKKHKSKKKKNKKGKKRSKSV